VYNYSSNCWTVDVWSVNLGAYVQFVSYCGNNPAGNSSLEFGHYGYNLAGSGYCTALGAWNVANVAGVYKYVPGGYPYTWVQMPLSDTTGTNIHSQSPCMNGAGGTGAWYYVDSRTSPLSPAWSPTRFVAPGWWSAAPSVLALVCPLVAQVYAMA
jgi:hypothetical protein